MYKLNMYACAIPLTNIPLIAMQGPEPEYKTALKT